MRDTSSNLVPPLFFLLVLDTDLIFYRSIMALAIDTMVLRASH